MPAFHSSVAPVIVGPELYPPNATADEFDALLDAKLFLPIFISVDSVQTDPFQDSVFAEAPVPPELNASELLDPAPALTNVALFISATSVHEVPFQDSVLASVAAPGFSPAKAK